MTLTYLRDGLLTCSVVWADFEYLTLKFIKILMQLCNFANFGAKIYFRTLKTTAHTFFSKSRLRLRNPFLGVRFLCACLQLWGMCKSDDFPRGFVDFQRFHLLNRNPFR